MKVRKLKIILLSILAVIIVYIAMPGHANAQDSKMPDEILHYVNKHRATLGLPKLEMNDVISEVAYKHSRDMASGRLPLGHDGFDGRVKTISKRLGNANAFAENVAYGAMGAEEVVKMWLNSKGHRQNIEGHYNLTGIAIDKAKNGDLYFTQIFILKN